MTQTQNDTALVQYNGTSTDLVPSEEEQPLTDIMAKSPELEKKLNLLRDGVGLPIHEQFLLNTFTPEEAELIANDYYGLQPVPLSRYVNKEIMVLGMIVYEQMPFKSKKTDAMVDGYYQIRILIEEDKTKEHVLLKTSSIGVARHAFNIIRNRGWFKFDHPVRYLVSVGENNAQYIYNVEKVKSK